MSTTKILDLIPESLRPTLIEEVKELISQGDQNDQDKEPTKQELEKEILEWAKNANSQK